MWFQPELSSIIGIMLKGTRNADIYLQGSSEILDGTVFNHTQSMKVRTNNEFISLEK